MSNASTFPTIAPVAPGIYIDEIDPGTTNLPAVTRELVRASLEQICDRELASLVYEDDTPKTRMHLIENLQGHLVMRWVKNVIKGGTAQEAFFIRCDHTTMTQSDIGDGFLICEVGMAPVNPSEFVVFRILVRFATRS